MSDARCLISTRCSFDRNCWKYLHRARKSWWRLLKWDILWIFMYNRIERKALRPRWWNFPPTNCCRHKFGTSSLLPLVWSFIYVNVQIDLLHLWEQDQGRNGEGPRSQTWGQNATGRKWVRWQQQEKQTRFSRSPSETPAVTELLH